MWLTYFSVLGIIMLLTFGDEERVDGISTSG